MLTPSAQDGNGTWGRVKRTWPDTRFPKTISRTTRRTITAIPSLTNTTIERDQGALVRRAETTNAATEATSRRRIGLVVRDAAPARQAAHSHHAAGCRPRRPEAVRTVHLGTGRLIAGAIADASAEPRPVPGQPPESRRR